MCSSDMGKFVLQSMILKQMWATENPSVGGLSRMHQPLYVAGMAAPCDVTRPVLCPLMSYPSLPMVGGGVMSMFPGLNLPQVSSVAAGGSTTNMGTNAPSTRAQLTTGGLTDVGERDNGSRRGTNRSQGGNVLALVGDVVGPEGPQMGGTLEVGGPTVGVVEMAVVAELVLEMEEMAVAVELVVEMGGMSVVARLVVERVLEVGVPEVGLLSVVTMVGSVGGKMIIVQVRIGQLGAMTMVGAP